MTDSALHAPLVTTPARWPRGQITDYAWLLAVMLLSLAAKLYLLQPVGPVVFYDELLYRQGAEAIAHSGHYPGGHYPFGYPAMIAPAFFLGLGYAGAVVINIITTTALIPACYLLGRAVRSPHALLAAVLAALLPIHAALPTQLLSENLFVPAFTFVTWFAIRGRCSSVPSALLFGFALGFLFLVKYLALPSIPVIWAIWVIGLRTYVAASPTERLVPVPQAALASVAGIGASLAAWVIYAHANDIALLKASAKISGIHTNAVSAASIAMWLCVYAAAATLLAGPFLAPLIQGARAVAREPKAWTASPMARLVVTTLVLSAGFVLVATLHSAGGADNYPVPQRVISRYLMMLTPLYVVVGTANAAVRPPGWTAARSALIAVLAVASVLLAHGVLYDNAVWSFPAWFATIPQYSSDTLGYHAWWMLLFLAGMAALGAFAWMHRGLWIAWVLGVTVLFAASLTIVDQHSKATTAVRPMHARMLANVVLRALQSTDSVVVVSDIKSERPPVMGQALVFWGVPKRRIKVVGYPHLKDIPLHAGVPVFLITSRRLPAELVLQYRYGSRDGFIYRLDQTQAGAPSVPKQSD